MVLSNTRLAPLALAAAAVLAGPAQAATQIVSFNTLNASTTLGAPFAAGDDLRLNTLDTTETGALQQTITFSLGASVGTLGGQASWEVNAAAGTGPWLTGVNIDIFNAADALVASDSFQGVLGNFAVSTFSGAIGPGTYRMMATGTGVRASSLDVTLLFTSPVPEPRTYGLMLAGLGVLGFVAKRRSRS